MGLLWLLAVAVAAVVSRATCAANTAADARRSTSALAQPVSWFVEPASLKIAQSLPASALPTSANAIDLALQAGECESRQLRLRSTADVRDISIELPAAVAQGWRWTARQVGYVRCKTATMYNCSGANASDAADDGPCTPGWRPDPLLPATVNGIVAPYIPSQTTQPVFLTLCVPTSAAAGSSSALLRVRGRLGACGIENHRRGASSRRGLANCAAGCERIGCLLNNVWRRRCGMDQPALAFTTRSSRRSRAFGGRCAISLVRVPA